jgi:hypothetical protein
MRWFPGLRQDWLYCLHPLGEAFARVTPEAILQAPVAARLRAAGQGPRQARCHRCPAIAAPVWNGRVDHKCGAHGRNPKNDRQATEIIDLAGGPGFEPRLPGSEPGVLPLNYPPPGPGAAVTTPLPSDQPHPRTPARSLGRHGQATRSLAHSIQHYLRRARPAISVS